METHCTLQYPLCLYSPIFDLHFQLYAEVKILNMGEFYLGGVPEAVEPVILNELSLDIGFTGCIQLKYAGYELPYEPTRHVLV